MPKTDVQYINATYEVDGETFTEIVHFPASRESVELVLAAPIDGPDDHDGRSEFRWFMLPTGDWILGVWPHGDTYMRTELDREWR